MFLNFEDKSNLIALLKTLKVEQQPEWGIMTPQHMIEHLIVTVKISNGGLSIACAVPKEQVPQYKQVILESDQEMPRGRKANGMDCLLDLRYESLEKAIDKLETEIDKFHTFFDENPDAKPVNPVLDEVGYNDWKTFHKKHFTHHFKQFNLM